MPDFGTLRAQVRVGRSRPRGGSRGTGCRWRLAGLRLRSLVVRMQPWGTRLLANGIGAVEVRNRRRARSLARQTRAGMSLRRGRVWTGTGRMRQRLRTGLATNSRGSRCWRHLGGGEHLG